MVLHEEEYHSNRNHTHRHHPKQHHRRSSRLAWKPRTQQVANANRACDTQREGKRKKHEPTKVETFLGEKGLCEMGVAEVVGVPSVVVGQGWIDRSRGTVSESDASGPGWGILGEGVEYFHP